MKVGVTSGPVGGHVSPCRDETHSKLSVRRGDLGQTGWSSKKVLSRHSDSHSHWGFGQQLNPWRSALCPDCDSCPLPRKCLYQVAAVLWCWDRKTERRQSGRLSGLANASGLLRPPRCAGGRWQSEGRRCLSQRCPTQSCWLLPEAHRSRHLVMKQGAPSPIWIVGSFPRLCEICTFFFFTSAHLWMVSGPTPPSTSMSNEGNWLLNQLTWITRTRKKKREAHDLRKLTHVSRTARSLIYVSENRAVKLKSALFSTYVIQVNAVLRRLWPAVV